MNVIASEEDAARVYEPPAGLDMKAEVADLHELAVAISGLTPWAELENYHVRDAPAVAEWLPNQHAKLRRDSVGERFHGDNNR